MSEKSALVGELAELVGGDVEGNPDTLIRGAAPLASVGPGQITLIDQPERVRQLTSIPAAAVVLPKKFDWKLVVGGEALSRLPAIRVADVHAAFTKIVLHFRPPRRQPVLGVSSHAFVSRSARWGKGVSIHAGATVGDDCHIGDGTTIQAGAHLLAGCRIGRDV